MNESGSKIQREISIFGAVENLRRFFFYLVHHWKVLLLIGFAGALIGVGWAWTKANKYVAELTFSVEEEQGLSGGLMGLASTIGLDIGSVGGAFSGDNIIELLRSRTIMERALLHQTRGRTPNFSLLDYYVHDVAKIKAKDSLNFAANQPRNTYSRLQDSIVKVAIRNINLSMLEVGKPDKKLNFIRVACASPQEQFSKELVDNLIDEVSKFYIEIKTARNRKNVSLLQQKADSLGLAISSNIGARASITDANINTYLQTPMVGVQKSQFNISALSAAYSEVLKNLEIAKFNLQRETPFIQVVDRPIYPLENKKKGRLYGAVVFGFFAGIFGIFLLYVAFAWKEMRRFENSAIV